MDGSDFPEVYINWVGENPNPIFFPTSSLFLIHSSLEKQTRGKWPWQSAAASRGRAASSAGASRPGACGPLPRLERAPPGRGRPGAPGSRRRLAPQRACGPASGGGGAALAACPSATARRLARGQAPALAAPGQARPSSRPRRCVRGQRVAPSRPQPRPRRLAIFASLQGTGLPDSHARLRDGGGSCCSSSRWR